MVLRRLAVMLLSAAILAAAAPACGPLPAAQAAIINTTRVYEQAAQCLVLLDLLALTYLDGLPSPTHEELLRARQGILALSSARIELAAARGHLGNVNPEMAHFALLHATDYMRAARAWLRGEHVDTSGVDPLLDSLP